jgi:hypothetical protein
MISLEIFAMQPMIVAARPISPLMFNFGPLAAVYPTGGHSLVQRPSQLGIAELPGNLTVSTGSQN